MEVVYTYTYLNWELNPLDMTLQEIKKGIAPRNSSSESKPFSYYAAEQMKTLKLQEGTYVKRLGSLMNFYR
jgi:hypothetical protein